MHTLTTLAGKVFGLFLGRYSLMQILQRVNRSPLRYFVKAVVTLTDLPGKARRRRYARCVLRTAGHAGELRTSGMCCPAIDPRLRQELADEAFRLWRSAGSRYRRANKGYLTAFIAGDLTAGRIDNRSIFVRYAAQPSVVDEVAAHFGEAPYLSYVALDLSEHVGDEFSTSQLWHCDHDDTKVVKLFAYLTDVVSEREGPFTFIPPRPSRRIRGAHATHLPDANVFSRVPADVVIRITGSAGTAFLVDTGRCYHMGSRVAPGGQRLMYTACYITRPAIYPNFLNKIASNEPLSERERLLLRP